MLTRKQAKEKLTYMNLARVAKAAGVNYQTVYNLVRTNSNISSETLEKLSDFLEGKEPMVEGGQDGR